MFGPQSGTTCMVPLYSQSAVLLMLTPGIDTYLLVILSQRRMSASFESDQLCTCLPVAASKTLSVSLGGTVNQYAYFSSQLIVYSAEPDAALYCQSDFPRLPGARLV